MGEGDECLKSLSGAGGGGEISPLRAAFVLWSNMLFGSLGHLIPFAVGAHLPPGLALLAVPGLRGAAGQASRGWRAARKRERVLAAVSCSEVFFSPRLGFCRVLLPESGGSIQSVLKPGVRSLRRGGLS